MITKSINLRVLGTNEVLVPGCEPTSTVTSTKLYQEMSEQGLCTSALAPLDAILEAIPGSVVVFIKNYGGPPRKFLRLPAEVVGTCPCVGPIDFYQMIKDVSRDATVEEITELLCEAGETVDQGFCRP